MKTPPDYHIALVSIRDWEGYQIFLRGISNMKRANEVDKVAKILEECCEDRCWHLHMYDYITSFNMFRARIRFPCRDNIDMWCTYPDANLSDQQWINEVVYSIEAQLKREGREG